MRNFPNLEMLDIIELKHVKVGGHSRTVSIISRNGGFTVIINRVGASFSLPLEVEAPIRAHIPSMLAFGKLFRRVCIRSEQYFSLIQPLNARLLHCPALQAIV